MMLAIGESTGLLYAMRDRRNSHTTNFLVTGGTGLIGGELIRALESADVGKIICLVRGDDDCDAASRLNERLGRKDSDWSQKLRIQAADVTKPDLGIDWQNSRDFLRDVDVVIHCAACTYFHREKECWETNVDGLANTLSFVATLPQPVLFVYLSSAAVCGARQGEEVLESDPTDSRGPHYAPYTVTKAAAEEYLRRQNVVENWVIVRPSFVIPDSVTNQEILTEVLWPFVLMSRCRYLPIDPTARVDVVPVSLLCDWIISLVRKPRLRHRCYHASAGSVASRPWGDVMSLVCSGMSVSAQPQYYAEGDEESVQGELTPQERRILRLISCYLPFINQDVVFANGRLSNELGSEVLQVPCLESYVPMLVRQVTMGEAWSQSQITMPGRPAELLRA